MTPGRSGWPVAGPAWRRTWAAVLLAVAVLAGALGCAGRAGPPPSTRPAGTAGSAAASATAPAWVRTALRGSPVWGLSGVEVQAGPVEDLPGDATGDAAGSGSGAAFRREAPEVAVVGASPEPELTTIREIAAEAVRTVDKAWRRPWPQRLLVVAPADRAQWQTISRAPAGDGTGPGPPGSAGDRSGGEPTVAAAMTVDGADGSAYVVIDPVAWQVATQVGRRVLLIHEAVHVAVRADAAPDGACGAPCASAPLWLSEGYAQFVAYEAVGVEPRQVVGDLREHIRRHGPPRALPGVAELTGPARGRLNAYAQAWLACRTLAAQAGSDAPRRAMEAGSVAAVGIDEPTLTRAWREDLRRLARAGDRPAS